MLQHAMCCLFLLATSFTIVKVFYDKQPESFMDEIFHFPQAVRYFHGDFLQWDSKITTPPGLYLISVGILVPLSKLTGFSLCGLLSFRLINLLFTMGNFYVLYEILKRTLEKGTPHHVVLLSALNLTIFPLLYYFTFLYYTDCGSVFFTLLMYLHHIRQENWLAAAYGGIAVLFRQTNIIWVFMVAAQESFHILQEHVEGSNRKNKFREKMKERNLTSGFQNVKVLFDRVAISHLLYVNFGYILIGFSFIVFVFINKSIVLGDKEAHQACFNVPQLFYFLLFVLFFAAPYHCSIKKLYSFWNFVLQHRMYIALCFFICILSLKYLSHIHPYLLADNRHLTFYLWRRLLNRNIFVSFSLIPLYIFSGWSMFTELHHKDFQWKFIFTLCVIAASVPQKLLELRYFIIPYILFRINVRSRSLFQPACEFILYVLVNLVTLYIFFQTIFFWENDTAVQRIMW